MNQRPLIPMGAITGNPTREDLRKTLQQYRDAGFEQFMIYARSGLEVEYMGPEWLRICSDILEFCAEHGMTVYLYDEYNWPSGKCRGKVIRRNPDFSSKKLVAFADRNFMGVEDNQPASEYFWTECLIPLYADLLDPAAVDCFIELTHEVYFRHFGKYFGSVIKGIFSDEPSFMYAKFQPVQGSALELPFYRSLEEDYQERTASNLRHDLELYLQGKPPKHLWPTYHDLMGKRFCRVYLEKIRSWCEQHAVVSTGHLMSEATAWAAIRASGRPIDAMRSFSMPGIDDISTRTNFSSLPLETFKLLESAMFGPRTEALAELFALGPCDLTLCKMREMIYLVALHGVNHYVTAVSMLDARGNVEKAYYYNPVSPAQPYFRYLGELNRSAAIAAELTRCPSSASIALRYPQAVTAAHWNANKETPLPISYAQIHPILYNAQWEYRVIGDNEKASPMFRTVLNLTERGIVDETTGTELATADALLAYLEQNSSRRNQLCNADGSPVENIVLKTYDDGKVCVINTSGKNLHNVHLNDKVAFDLYDQEVKILPEAISKSLSPAYNASNDEFSLEFENTGTFRLFFEDRTEAQFTLSEPSEVIFALRQYSAKAEYQLDGIALPAPLPCSTLPEGIGNLYSCTPPQKLGAGVHTLTLSGTAKELPYLPLALCCGNFAPDRNGILKPFPSSGCPAEQKHHLPQYTGTFLCRREMDLSAFEALEMECCELPIELLLNRESQGVRLWKPFRWNIPAEMRKSVEVTFRVATSVGPLFGDYPNRTRAGYPKWLDEFWPKQ